MAKTRTEAEEIPTLDDLMGDIETQARGNAVGGKVMNWLDRYPDKAKLFWAAIDAARERGYSVNAVIKACQSKLGGPPGSESTVRIAVNERNKSRSE